MDRRTTLKSRWQALRRGTAVVLRDIGNGALELSHNSLALVGLAVLLSMAYVAGNTELRTRTETLALGWLQERHGVRADEADDPAAAAIEADADAVNRATAVHTAELSRPQAAVAQWISRRYAVAPEPVGRLVQEAWVIGQKVGLDPTLILAVVAIESRFNPFAQSPMGAQGLMQVMTRVHVDKYQPFGGTHAAFDPISNLKVGVQVLRECIARAGSVEAGIRWYVGAANLASDGGYLRKVLTEQGHMKRVSNGGSVATNVPIYRAPKPTAPAQEASAEPAQPAEPKAAQQTVPELVALAD